MVSTRQRCRGSTRARTALHSASKGNDTRVHLTQITLQCSFDAATHSCRVDSDSALDAATHSYHVDIPHRDLIGVLATTAPGVLALAASGERAVATDRTAATRGDSLLLGDAFTGDVLPGDAFPGAATFAPSRLLLVFGVVFRGDAIAAAELAPLPPPAVAPFAAFRVTWAVPLADRGGLFGDPCGVAWPPQGSGWSESLGRVSLGTRRTDFGFLSLPPPLGGHRYTGPPGLRLRLTAAKASPAQSKSIENSNTAQHNTTQHNSPR